MQNHTETPERRLGRAQGDQGDKVLLVIRELTSREGEQTIVIGAHVDGIREASRWSIPAAGFTEPLLNAMLVRLEHLGTAALVSALGGAQQIL